MSTSYTVGTFPRISLFQPLLITQSVVLVHGRCLRVVSGVSFWDYNRKVRGRLRYNPSINLDRGDTEVVFEGPRRPTSSEPHEVASESPTKDYRVGPRCIVCLICQVKSLFINIKETSRLIHKPLLYRTTNGRDSPRK